MDINSRPFYKKLYADMIRDKYPEKSSRCTKFFQKETWIALDVIQINEILFGTGKDKSDVRKDRMHRAYDTESILNVLKHQNENKLTNLDLSKEFGISRNTIRKWKLAFKDEIETFL